ncbi:MAG: response regulator transcription factor [Bryobacterales bacterium]|nr:response regulator transcription factor [Bryobacterales bacterium]
MPSKVAVIEDDRDLTGLLQYALEQEGFEVACIHDGLAAIDFCQRVQPDAIVLDVMLPGLDGFSVCKELRQDPGLRDIPVVFLTARTEEADRLRGLEIGGDDYVVKPFSVKELVVRLKLRLRSSRALDSLARVGGLELDKDRREVRLQGRAIPVTATEFQILEKMLRQPGRVWSREALLQAVWGLACHVTDRTVDVHIRRLRSKLEADPSNPQYIRSVRGFGYTVRDPSEGSSNLNGSAART